MMLSKYVKPGMYHTTALIKYSAIFLLLCMPFISYAQVHVNSSGISPNGLSQTVAATDVFIENIGQYGKSLQSHESMGNILFGYEGLEMPVLFTPKGLIHLQRKIKNLSHEEEERLEKQGVSEEEIESKKHVTDRVITMEWLGASTNVRIVKDAPAGSYHTYGLLPGKAYGYKKIIYKNIYPGIDIVYSFVRNGKPGFEYSIIAMPGADLSLVKMKITGDVRKIKKDKDGGLLIQSDINGVAVSVPVSFYADSLLNRNSPTINSTYTIQDKEISLSFAGDYDHSKILIVDPFITTTGNLTGINAGKAKDVDFDYAGNIYVTGGGDGGSSHRLAKYNAAGALQWTFNGTLTIPSWSFGTYFGGWMVEKPTGNVYLGQGFNPTTGFQVIRVNTTGLYDNYITTANPNFREAWKMYWSCNNGSPQILVAGGGTNSDINFGVFVPPATAISSLNVTGIPYTGSAGWAQDIVDFIIDPANNDMYTIYGSLIGNPSLTNQVYKNTAPYSGASVAWNVPSGFVSVQEIQNRPYLVGGPIDNSANIFAINRYYLYYWDGKNLKAFDKATGNTVGTPFITANTKLMQGGISADDCNNIFVGEGNGIIKVYKFNGSVFDDAAAPDITIPGFAGRAVYDLAYDESKKLLYASGDGFVASFDVSAYCPSTQYTLNVVPNCITSSATVTVNPIPPPGASITYVLYSGSVQLATNTTGIFTGLSPNISYTIVATINLACSGTQATTTFILPGPTIAITQVNTTCGAANGSITATGSGTTGPYTYSIDGTNFLTGGTFAALAAGVYTITVKDANGCKSTATVVILNTNGPLLTYTSTNADCGNNNGTITASVSGGTAPYQYSINGITYQSGNFFTGLVGGVYTLTVKDANGCINVAVVTISSSPGPLITAIPATATCGSSNGSITAFGSGGTPPLVYSINGNVFQASNVFINLTPGTYTVTVKDANDCIKTTTVTIANSPAPTVIAVSTAAACSNINGTVTATGTGGLAPLQYSINGIIFQTGNVFTGLAAGIYTITVKDNTGCTNITSVTVGSTGGPAVTAVSTASACNTNTGTITVTASGGTPAYQYSINGINFQAGNLFTGLAAGSYTVYVRDAAGCTGTFSVVVANTAGPALSAAVSPTACNTNNGTITATGTGGTAPLQYSIDGTIYQLSNIFTGLATGIYTVYVQDANGCIKTTTATIVNVSGLTLAASSITSSCSINNGSITATATGGILPLQYSIDGVIYQAGNVFSNLAPGIYTVYVKDANNCIVTQQVTVASFAGPSLIVSTSDATCTAANGIIVATGSGGVAPLTYSINGVTFQSSGTFLNVAAGTYTVIVKDAAGCTASEIVTISTSGGGPAISTFTVVAKGAYPCNGSLGKITNPKVNGANCNTCTFSLNGGPFIPNATQLFTNLNPGVYTVTAMDANGCTKTISVTIGLATLSTASAVVTGTNCNASTGTITLTGIGPNTPYHASITGIGGPWITFDPTYTFTGLAPGVYTIILSDDESFDSGPPIDPGGCLDTITVIVPSIGGPSINAVVTAGTCGADNGIITANGSGGVAPLQYSIDGINYQPGGIFTDLPAGIYYVSVMDDNGCTAVQMVTVVNGQPPTLTAVITATTCGLNNGALTLTASGGTAPYQYSINGTTFQNSNIFTGLTAGNYTVYLKDNTACYSTINITIGNTALPFVSAYMVAATCNNNDGSIVATGTSGTPPYQYSVDGTVFQSSNIFTGLAAGFYTVTIKDASGCLNTTGLSVTNTGGPNIITAATVAAKCGNSNGTITITVTGGTVPYQYSLDGIVFQAGNAFSGLAPGTYTVTVKDFNGCINTKTVLISNINGPQLLTAAIVHAACGSGNGSITATASGGTAPLQYSVDGIVYQATTVFNALPAAAYTLYVKDANGCIKTLPVVVQNLAGPSLSTTSSAASCSASDGTITATVTGGTGIITYSKDGTTFQASNIFTGLAAGSYTITVKDARGCLATSTITVTTFGILNTPTFNPVAAICSGAALSALPTTSLNGINGSWSPALNNTATTNYTFTPTAGQCATTATLTITVNPNITPTFNPVAAICSGGILSALPTTSLNGINGSWSPALNNTATTTYTFTPTAGQCATTTTLTITVNPNITPTFNPVAAICLGAALSALPTTSLNGINGSWSPALNNTATTTYTFTPTAGQCAALTTLTITVNPILSATINCGVSTSSSVIFTWAAVSGATGYTVSYQVNANPVVNIGPIGNLLTYQVTGLNGGDNVSITLTPTGAVGTCFIASTQTCTAIACTPPTASISYATPFCASINTAQPVTLTGTGLFTGGTYTASPAGLAINSTTGEITPSTSTAGITYTVTYTIAAGGGCAAVIATTTVTIDAFITPTFNPVAAICSGGTLSALPTTSLNGINGSWSPALNNTATTNYTFTPTAGQCATTATLTITVNPNITPTFNPVAAICSGTTLTALPTISLNGINGSWSPALNNTTTTTYTFTPTAGQCATATTLTITVSPNITPTFNPVAAICSGGTLSALPTTSLNGINGSWSPALNNTATTTYTFTPTAGQCATATTLTITVNPNITPTFNPVAAICSGAALSALPTTSLNGINGSWSPALNNTATTTYTFTPTAGQCAALTTLTITVNPILSATINCGVSTSSSVIFTWAAVSGATGYTVSYQVNANPVVNIGPIGNLVTYQVTGLNGGDNVSITLTPTGAVGTCFVASTQTCTAIACTPPTASISYATPFCSSISTAQPVTLTGTGLFTGGIYTASPAGLAINNTTGEITPLTSTAGITYTVTYTIAAGGGCAAVIATTPVTITAVTIPTFNSIAAICSGSALSALPTTSLNGINGNWSPALNNTTTTTYTFTPTAGQCATTATLIITVNPNITPTFNPIAAICSGGALSALPITSLNGINGSWSPALNNTATTNYTFTPTAGQCATTTTLTITVNPNITPIFNPVTAICSGATLSALPTTSLNGINGSWSPALNNTTTTTYTFTPTAGQCATTATLTITINPNITPTFNPVAAICSGATLSALPTTSLNGINGSWSPALNNTTTTTYTFTPTAGQCATTTTLTITVNPNITPTFNPVAAICSGGTLSALPTTSLNAINGSWSPALNNTTTTTYTFTPTAGQCATINTLTITVNPILSATINCGVSTSSSVIFTWAAVSGATGYTVSYQVNANPVVNVGSIGNVLTYQVTGLASGDNVSITLTPTGGAGTCFIASTQSCTAIACTPATASISYATPFCTSINTAQPVTLTGTGLFTGGTYSASPAGLTINSSTGEITPSTSTAGVTYTVTYTIPASGGCAAVIATTSVTIDAVTIPTFNPVTAICSGAALAALPTTSLNGINGSWSPALNNTATTNYTFTPTAGQCATTTTLTITVNPNITPTFNPVAAICSGGTLSALSTTSLNGINGSWSPALNNTTTTTYTFTPTAGQCATTATLTITVNPNITPTFNPVAAICSGASLSALPSTSLNGINGSWSPALNNTTTTTYTFTPTAGQCATTTTLTITVNPNITPTFNPVASICSGSALSALPITSLNGINGSWSPALNNTTTTTYTFTPTAGQCATTTTLTITVSPNITPTFNPVAAICSGAALTALPTISLNGINGSWSPALNNTTTTTYTFTPTAGQCATTATLTITVNPNITPTFNPVAAICSGASLSALPSTSLNGINGSWSPALNNTATTNYTFTPTAGQCATTTTLTITVNPNITPTFNPVAAICSGAALTALPTTSLNGINGTWSPALNNTTTTTYTFTPAAGGICVTTANLTIVVNPAPIARAGADAKTCFGNNITLHGSGGISYLWSPSTYLSNTAIANPVVASSVPGTITYLLDVTDINGCRSARPDTVIITILPPVKVFAGNDTAVAINQPLQLNALDLYNSGFSSYTWSPSLGLNDPLIKNPVALLDNDITYIVTAITPDNCISQDNIIVKVYRGPEIYVPTAFTPNNDGTNDIFKPILAGIRELKYFAVYNRYGELVYRTSEQGKGWDGIYKGQAQHTGTFVWIAQAVDYKGNVLNRKGSVVLIR